MFRDLLEGNFVLRKPYFGWKKLLHQNYHKANNRIDTLQPLCPPFQCGFWMVLGSLKVIQDLFNQVKQYVHVVFSTAIP